MDMGYPTRIHELYAYAQEVTPMPLVEALRHSSLSSKLISNPIVTWINLDFFFCELFTFFPLNKYSFKYYEGWI
jgi:hypothetical protein